MAKDWVARYSEIGLTVSGLFIFLMVFLGAVYITFHKGRKSLYEKVQYLPLEEGGQHE